MDSNICICPFLDDPLKYYIHSQNHVHISQNTVTNQYTSTIAVESIQVLCLTGKIG